MLEIVLICLAFCLGVVCGTCTMLFLKGVPRYSGVINVTKTENKITYSLELDHDPEDLENMKVARFKIRASE